MVYKAEKSQEHTPFRLSGIQGLNLCPHIEASEMLGSPCFRKALCTTSGSRGPRDHIIPAKTVRKPW